MEDQKDINIRGNCSPNINMIDLQMANEISPLVYMLKEE